MFHISKLSCLIQNKFSKSIIDAYFYRIGSAISPHIIRVCSPIKQFNWPNQTSPTFIKKKVTNTIFKNNRRVIEFKISLFSTPFPANN